jgi:4a-hydroxytetrahydrobiopterin dehydratase
MSDLTARKCVPCEGGVAPLTPEQAAETLTKLGGWSLSEDGTEIRLTREFEDYFRTMAFVNAVAWIAHREDHHPDMEVGYNRCTVRYSTHAIGGLSENDFICAAKVDLLLKG